MEKNLTRQEREKKRHCYEILEVAERLFAEKGFHGTTMEEIAEKAEFSVGGLYNFFASKDKLYQELLEQRCRELADEALAAMRKVTDPISVIKAYIEAKVELSQKYVNFSRLYTRERLGDRFSDSELWWKVVAPIYEEVMKFITETFAAGIAAGIFRGDVSPQDMVIALEGLTDGFLYEWMMFPQKTSFKDKYQAMVQLFISGVRKE